MLALIKVHTRPCDQHMLCIFLHVHGLLSYSAITITMQVYNHLHVERNNHKSWCKLAEGDFYNPSRGEIIIAIVVAVVITVLPITLTQGIGELVWNFSICPFLAHNRHYGSAVSSSCISCGYRFEHISLFLRKCYISSKEMHTGFNCSGDIRTQIC